MNLDEEFGDDIKNSIPVVLGLLVLFVLGIDVVRSQTSFDTSLIEVSGTLVLTIVTAAYVFQTNKLVKQNNLQSKRSDIKKLIAYGVDPIREIVSYNSEAVNREFEGYECFDYIRSLEDHEDYLGDLARVDLDTLNKLTKYRDDTHLYKKKRRALKEDLMDYLVENSDSLAEEVTKESVSSDQSKLDLIEFNDHDIADRILNPGKGNKMKEDKFKFFEENLEVFLDIRKNFKSDIDYLSILKERITETNPSLDQQLREARNFFLNKYDIMKVEIKLLREEETEDFSDGNRPLF
jgi:hypothetical protein